MATTEDELQAAADRGDLATKSNLQIRKALEQTERRWIVIQVKEVAIHQALTPVQFRELCETIRTFIQPEQPPGT